MLITIRSCKNQEVKREKVNQEVKSNNFTEENFKQNTKFNLNYRTSFKKVQQQFIALGEWSKSSLRGWLFGQRRCGRKWNLYRGGFRSRKKIHRLEMNVTGKVKTVKKILHKKDKFTMHQTSFKSNWIVKNLKINFKISSCRSSLSENYWVLSTLQVQKMKPFLFFASLYSLGMTK